MTLCINKSTHRLIILLTLVASIFSHSLWANDSYEQQPMRIVSLAPHLTEWIYSLGLENNLVAVSDYSNYPLQAKSLPRVANYQGADISAIMALQPTLILAWDGGNKPQDIQRLTSLGYSVFSSKITHIDDIASEIERLGVQTNTQTLAKNLATHFRLELQKLRLQYQTKHKKTAFYYSWSSPLMSIGEKAWPNKLLNVCGVTTIFDDSPIDYPEVSLQQVLSRQPDVLVAASNQPTQQLELYWSPHRQFLTAPLIQVNPDITSRFSLRLINELKKLCKAINS